MKEPKEFHECNGFFLAIFSKKGGFKIAEIEVVLFVKDFEEFVL